MSIIQHNSETSDKKWQFWIDRGGTFTDIVARDPLNNIHTLKLLSENNDQYDDAALAAIRKLMGTNEKEPINTNLIQSVKMGTTVATNALLERKGERTLLVITKGFKDALKIGYQARPRLFDLDVILPEQLYEKVIEAEERMGPNGEVITPLDISVLTKEMTKVFHSGITSVAIVSMHGYKYPDHEEKIAVLACEIGFTQISTSHQTSPLMKLVGRGDTTVVDAYLSPILRSYIDKIQSELEDVPIYFMQSNGGLVAAEHFQGKDAILSGPAGGIVGAVKTASDSECNKLIAFDMGGTSTDVSHYNGDYERAYETIVAGVRMRTPMMNIHTVAAGGGSILHYDGARFRVGPDSAGANPGPCCYRAGGPLTITDCNLLLGFINPKYFPSTFGENADQSLDREAVKEKFKILTNTIKDISTPEEVAEGFLRVAIENMAAAIKKYQQKKAMTSAITPLLVSAVRGDSMPVKLPTASALKEFSFIHSPGY